MLVINFPSLQRWLTQSNAAPLAPQYNYSQTLPPLVSQIFPYVYLLSGLILFFFLIWGGFELLTAAGNQESIKKATGRITSALTGFVIIFLSYWLIRILEIILGIKIF